MGKNILFLAAGIALGVLGSLVGVGAMRNAEVSSIMKETGLSFEQCNDADSAARKRCVNDALLNEAVRVQNPALCQHIADESQKSDCSRRLALISELGAAGTQCKGQGSESLCYDITALMAAVESREISRCNMISSPVLFSSCSELISGQRPVGSDVAVTAPRSRYTYGLQCDSNDTVCAADKRAFNAAVRSMSVGACDPLATKALCVAEALYYQAYQTGDYSGCAKQFETDAPCRTVVTIAKAVDAGNPQACDSLAEGERNACKEIVRVNKEKRFEYLNESL